jgi:hypothetical protein
MTNMAMKKSLAPLYLWDFCLDLQSMIQLSIAHNIYALNDNVPNTAVILRISITCVSLLGMIGYGIWTQSTFPRTNGI